MIKSQPFETIKDLMLNPQPDYVTAKHHAQILDDLLGYHCQEIEAALDPARQRTQTCTDKKFWIGLDIQIFQTPYSEMVQMINLINPQKNDLWLDLGAAYGRMGIVLGFIQPEVKFLGYEFIMERVDEGNRLYQKWNIDNAVLKQIDLTSSDYQLEEAELYFIYDFGSRSDIYHILEKLRAIANKKPITVIARGRGVRQWIMLDFPWLSQITQPIHFENWSIFKS